MRGFVLAFGVICAGLAVAQPLTVVDLQSFRQEQEIHNDRGDTVRLINLNPNVGAWYVLETNFAGKKSVFHLELALPSVLPAQKLKISLYRDGLILPQATGDSCSCSLWNGANSSIDRGMTPFLSGVVTKTNGELNANPVLADVLQPPKSFAAPLTPICDGQLFVRTQFAGSTTTLEAATDTLRKTRLGGWLVEAVKPYLIEAPEEGEQLTDPVKKKSAPAEASLPRSAVVNPDKADRFSEKNRLGIENDAENHKLYYGQWYKAIHHDGVYVSVMTLEDVAPEILSSFPDRAEVYTPASRGREVGALAYFAAFDMSRFAFGYGLGAEHPGVEWSDHAKAVPHIPPPGPDGIGNKRPLATVGSVPPYYLPQLEAVFSGGFKRQHGAFHSGELGKVNNGSHFGFMEQGVVFSKLQPGLATARIGLDGALSMLTWPADDKALLPELRAARQNCLPLIEGYDTEKKMPIPGQYLKSQGLGAWSGDKDGNFLTIRSGIGVQEVDGRKYLLFGYFTGATPSSMARVFQAYDCKYAMILDINTPNYGYIALYLRDASGEISGVENLNTEMAGGAVDKNALKFIQKDDTRDFFCVLRKP
ncbi:MAG: hypothetical protein HZB26_23310 [Candidatus Hydrogenedentes bacterium]|nr:hypothetical protein [Candidatus Hydrogenedentota bacterium]